MGRAKNTELREKISAHAVKLFSEKGYVNTSFADIARECGVERTIVQYYFPYKDILIREFLDKCLKKVAEMAEELSEERFDAFGRAYFMGVASFEFIINCKKMEKMALDIIESRQLTSLIIPLYCQWDKWLTGDDFQEDATIMAIGGAYELLYHYMKNGIEISSEFLAEKSYYVFTSWHGVSHERAKEKLLEYCITEEEVKAAAKKIEKALF